MENNDTNSKQDKAISALRTDVHWIKGEMKSVKEQVSNHIPTKIEKLRSDFNDYKLANTKWQNGILVAVILIIIEILAGFVLTRFF